MNRRLIHARRAVHAVDPRNIIAVALSQQFAYGGTLASLSPGDQEPACFRWCRGAAQQGQSGSGRGPQRCHGGNPVLEGFTHGHFSQESVQIDVLIAQA